jgi:hypothetical protein
MLEDELFRAGVRIRDRLDGARDYVRPMGLDFRPTHGFGTMLCTVWGCPNHAPLALWFADEGRDESWYPLLPRDPERQREDLWEMDAVAHVVEAVSAGARLPAIRPV